MKKMICVAAIAAVLVIGFVAGARLTVLTAEIEVGQGEVYLTAWGMTDVYDVA